jgi:hypothetical protein
MRYLFNCRKNHYVTITKIFISLHMHTSLYMTLKSIFDRAALLCVNYVRPKLLCFNILSKNHFWENRPLKNLFKKISNLSSRETPDPVAHPPGRWRHGGGPSGQVVQVGPEDRVGPGLDFTNLSFGRKIYILQFWSKIYWKLQCT